jgi:hypothetical protein
VAARLVRRHLLGLVVEDLVSGAADAESAAAELAVVLFAAPGHTEA